MRAIFKPLFNKSPPPAQPTISESEKKNNSSSHTAFDNYDGMSLSEIKTPSHDNTSSDSTNYNDGKSQVKSSSEQLVAWRNRNNIIDALVSASGSGAEIAVRTRCNTTALQTSDCDNDNDVLWRTVSDTTDSESEERPHSHLFSVAVVKLAKSLISNNNNEDECFQRNIFLHVELSSIEDAPEIIQVLHAQHKNGR